MVINSQKVTAFQITLILTEEEARRLMVDPEEFQSKLRSILDEHTAEKYMKHLGSNGKTNPKGIAPPNSNPKRGEKVQCEICDRMIASQQMSNHLSKKHGKASAHGAK